MLKQNSLNQGLNFLQKVRNIDYLLLVCILALSVISIISMYSTDGGQFLYHSQSHLAKFFIFFPMMIVFWIKILALFWIFILFNSFIPFSLGFFIWH